LAVDLFDRRRYSALVYHCVDFLGEYPGVDGAAFDRDERRLIHAADVTIGSSRALVAHLERQGAREVLYWPNPADCRSFAAAATTRSSRAVRVAGFAGAIDPNKLDLRLLADVAEILPDWRFEMLGPGDPRFPLPGNVRLRGHVMRQHLPQAFAGFDVGIIPYALTPYSSGVFPMKVFEYLAAGLPVVSTPLPSLVGEVEYVEFGADAESFAAALVRQGAPELREASSHRVAYALGHDWTARAQEAGELLARWGASCG
jgi:glycosyltransferase involved in cell wall biosynthesis